LKRVPIGRAAAAALFTVTILFSHPIPAATPPGEQPFVLETRNKPSVDAFRGAFSVPENRENRKSRSLTLRYVRLPATGDGSAPPIVYLAGGPGGSGIDAIGYRYDIFMAMRKYGDVIALDQRGTGASNDVPSCRSSQTIPTARAMSDREFRQVRRAALEECLSFWKQQKVDLAGYNTVQNALDLEALRRHLSADKIVLWGTSYGAHLALAALKEMEPRIAKVVISSVRGLDQSVKLPDNIEPYLNRLQRAVDSQPESRAAYGDIRTLMRRVHEKLEREPVPVKLKTGSGASVEYLLQRKDMQVLAVSLLPDPTSVARALSVYRALDEGRDPGIDRIPARLLPDHFVAAGEPVSLECMPMLTNITSGMSESRRSLVYAQARSALFGAYLDQILPYDGMARRLVLREGFRTPPSTNVPVLVFSGTLDGRTVLEDQLKAMSGLHNAVVSQIENAGHNLLDAPSSEMLALLDKFMTGGKVDERTISVGLPPLVPRAQ
jgi:pimeloyl-ACP methyl ester carboxylesterase